MVAPDAIDENLDLAVSATRAIHGSPAGPAVRVACTDADREWYLDLAEAGRRTIHREPIDVAMTLRGGAEALLLLLWAASTPRAPEVDRARPAHVNPRSWSNAIVAGGA